MPRRMSSARRSPTAARGALSHAEPKPREARDRERGAQPCGTPYEFRAVQQNAKSSVPCSKEVQYCGGADVRERSPFSPPAAEDVREVRRTLFGGGARVTETI